MNLLQQWKKVLEGEEAVFRPKGNSMKGLIESGSLVKVIPCNHAKLEVNDVVLVRVKGNIYLHKILAIKGERFLIGNNKGGINGWTGFASVAGLCVEVEGQKRPNIEGKLQ